MAADVENARIWTGAKVYVADVGTTPPTGLAAWGSGWEDLGLLSEDGMVESREVDSTSHYAYGGIHVRDTRTKFRNTMTVTCLEDNLAVWGLVNPGSTAVTASGITTRTVKVPSGSDVRAFGLELVDGEITKRRIIPRGEVVEVGDVTTSDNEMAMYELTIVIYPAANLDRYQDITDDPQAAV